MKALMFIPLILVLSAPAIAGVPSTMTYQGVLTDNGGAPVTDGNYSLTFRLYDAVASGNLLWEETQLVAVFGGVFTTLLGQVTPLALPFDLPYWISIGVNGGTELAPRTPLTTTPYSFGTRSIPDSVVTPEKIVGSAVVRSINGLQDHVHVRAEGGASLSVAGDTLVINAAAGGPSNTPWQNDGNDLYYTDGRIGIGTTSPLEDLHLGGGQSLLAGTDVTGGGNKLIWYGDLGAFRVGTVQNTSPSLWTRTNTGAHSFAAGLNTWAGGFASTAMGRDSWAIGNYSTALGFDTEVSAYASLAIGRFNLGRGNAAAWDPVDPVFEIGIGSSASDLANALTVLKNGNVGIGTHLPSALLEVNGTVEIGGGLAVTGPIVSSLGYAGARPYSDDVYSLGSQTRRWRNVWATNGTIQTSDVREKEAVEDCVYGLSEVMQMRPVRFRWKAHPEQGRKLGLIAQDLLGVLPEAVKTFAYEPVQPGPGADPTAEPELQRVELDRLGVYYSDLIPVLIKAIQEQQATIEVMQARIDRMEAR